ncbi:MAG: UMP kinase [Candidatus Hadarchaeum sp.]|uniref:UMP kinase n=1 Tax=Candidatus Hadarchaeum sp. TaxID=2883567 RepID=UPI003D0BEB46
MRITICFGGSILVPGNPDLDCIRDIVRTVRELKSRNHEVLIVVGGGELARVYINAARELGIPGVDQDQIGIAATRLNAQLLIAALGDIADPTPATVFEKAVRAMLRGKVPIMGGTTPGQTTDAVAAMLAQVSKSELLIFFTNVDGVYTADPKLDPNAKKLDRITPDELAKLVGTEFKPGMKTIMDPVAVKIIQRSNIKTIVLGKHEIPRLPEILNGAKHTGTLIAR